MTERALMAADAILTFCIMLFFGKFHKWLAKRLGFIEYRDLPEFRKCPLWYCALALFVPFSVTVVGSFIMHFLLGARAILQLVFHLILKNAPSLPAEFPSLLKGLLTSPRSVPVLLITLFLPTVFEIVLQTILKRLEPVSNGGEENNETSTTQKRQ